VNYTTTIGHPVYFNSTQNGTLSFDAATLQDLSRFKIGQLGGSSLVVSGPAANPSDNLAADVQDLITQTQQLELKLKHLKKQLSEAAAKASQMKSTGGSSESPKK
jgi:outer membrane murein-binding lipoprotein Lpp